MGVQPCRAMTDPDFSYLYNCRNIMGNVLKPLEQIMYQETLPLHSFSEHRAFRVGPTTNSSRGSYTQVPQNVDVERNEEVKVKLMDQETESDSEDDINNTVV